MMFPLSRALLAFLSIFAAQALKTVQVSLDGHVFDYKAAPAERAGARARAQPQSLTLGSFNQSAQPFISSDVWFELVDHEHVVMLRQGEPGFPGPKGLVKWLDSLPHKVSLLINNQIAKSFPELPEVASWNDVLGHRNLLTFFVFNPSIVAPNVIPIPLGPKWNFHHTQLFSEDKVVQKSLYTATSSDGETTAKLFSAPRQPMVWIRPMHGSYTDHNYARDNKALQATRAETVQMLQASLDHHHLNVTTQRLEQAQYMDTLKSFAFVVSPTGHGLDCHGTWEALMAGSVPILPHSPLDKAFADLPVWLVNDWAEVTSESMQQKLRELHSAGRTYNFGKLFAPYWKTKFDQLVPK